MALGFWSHPAASAAMAGAAAIGAQFIIGKAARDALFLAHFAVTTIPAMTAVSALVAMMLMVASSRWLSRMPPAVVLPRAFAVSAALFAIEGLLFFWLPHVAATLLYLHVSGLGPMLGSGFWLLMSERFDPHLAKRQFGRVAALGTIGGLVGGLAAARLSVVSGPTTMIPMLSLLSAVCALQVRALGRRPEMTARPAVENNRTFGSARTILSTTPYLGRLATVVLLGTLAAGIIDYLFKVQVTASFEGAALASFFSLYYAGLSLFTFVVQALGTAPILAKAGLAATMCAPSLALAGGGIAMLFAPGLATVTTARASEAVLRGSLLRAGYEVFYTPIPARDKRVVKALVDVGAERSGDILAAAIIWLVLGIGNQNLATLLLALAIGCSLAAIAMASRLNRGYTTALERSLLDHTIELDLSESADLQTRSTLLKIISSSSIGLRRADERRPTAVTTPDVAALRVLRSHDAGAIARLLRQQTPLPASLVPDVIALLDWDSVAPDAAMALRSCAGPHTMVLLNSLLDADAPFAVRRRLARVMAACRTQAAVDGLTAGLKDLRFEVRYECARALRTMCDDAVGLRMDRDGIESAILREVSVSRDIWTSRRLIDATLAHDPSDALLDLVTTRANRALAHVFTLLGLILPAEPLRIAFHGLHTNDQHLRGTALEYLESVLPGRVRERLWPFLEDDRPVRSTSQSADHALDQLLRSHESILLNLAQAHGSRPPGAAPGA
jgi:hypothetical protein